MTRLLVSVMEAARGDEVRMRFAALSDAWWLLPTTRAAALEIPPGSVVVIPASFDFETLPGELPSQVVARLDEELAAWVRSLRWQTP